MSKTDSWWATQMAEEGSVTRWLFGVLDCDNESVRRIWERYYHRLVQLARKNLDARAWGGIDEEDVALSALHSFVRRAETGEFRDLQGRDELWRLLAIITKRKALNVIRREMALRRGGGVRIETESAIGQVFRDEPTPDQTVELLDEAHRLLDVVLARGEPRLRAIAVRKLQGDDSAEIARQLGVSRRTVERKFQLIRKLWEADLESRVPEQ